MGATVNVNMRTVVHAASNGIFTAFPDVCKTPAPPAPSPIPIPYPNIAQSSDTDKGTKKVKIDKKPVNIEGSNFKMSTGDEAGSAGGGMVSSKNKGKAEWVMGSMDVKFEGKSAMRLADMMLGNKGGSPNTPPFPVVQPPLVIVPPVPKDDQEKNAVSAVAMK
jgi:Toxin PAAR-like domain